MSVLSAKRLANILIRVVYDVVALNLAILASIYLHYLRFLFVQHEGFRFTFDTYFMWTYTEMDLWQKYSVPFLIGAITTFWLFGFYNTSRFRRFRERLVFVLIGTVFVNGLLPLIQYFHLERDAFPRGVTILFFCFTLLFNALPRLIKPVALWASAQLTLPKERKNVKPKRVLVIGGAGYIGSVLSRHLLDSGYHVSVLDELLFGDIAVRDLLKNRKFQLFKGDCRNISEILPALEDVDAVVHLAGLVGDPACAVSEDLTIDINLAATRMLRELCKARGIDRLVFASTCSVYGVSSEVLDENSSLNPVSLYARTKIDSENILLKDMGDGLRPTVLRFATVYGLSTRPRFDLVVNTFVGHSLQRNQIEVQGGNQWRPFVHTRDIARAIERVLSSNIEKVGGQIFNVGDDRLNLTINDLASKVKRALPETEVINHGDVPDPRNYRVSFKKIREVLGFEAKYDVDFGIQELIQEFKDRKDIDLTSAFHNNYSQAKQMVALKDEVVRNRIYKADIEDGWVRSEMSVVALEERIRSNS